MIKLEINLTNQLLEKTLKEIKDFENGSFNTSDRTTFSQYQEVQDILTHQNGGFLKEWKGTTKDPRESLDIISPMVETGVANMDIDSQHLEPYTINFKHYFPELVVRSLVSQFHKQTNSGEKINDGVEMFIDDGNIVARKDDKDGELYSYVNLANLYVIDQTAKSLEDTDVIERCPMNQNKLREASGEWANFDKVLKDCNTAKKDESPLYDVYYRYGFVTREQLNYTKYQLHGEKYEEKDTDGDEYVQALFIMVKKNNSRKDDLRDESKAIPVFIEELKPEIIKISKHLIVKKWKPYVEAHFGKYKGTWLRKGYRSIGKPYQNRANELHNRLRQIMNHLKLIYSSDDDSFEGKNAETGFRDGQVFYHKKGTEFKVQNNQFPNLSIFVEEWDRNISLAEKALKAFEVATGESAPSSASATAISVQSNAVGKYHSIKQEKIGLFYAELYKRFVMPRLVEETDLKEKFEIAGDPSLIEEYADYKADKIFLSKLFEMTAKGMLPLRDQIDQIKDMIKSDILKQRKIMEDGNKDLLKDVEIYIGFNPTGEIFNKQNKISNGLKILEFELNDAIQGNPDAVDTINEIKRSLGLRVKPRVRKSVQQGTTQPPKMKDVPQVERVEQPV